MSYLNAKIANSQFVHLSDTQQLFQGQDALPVLVINSPFCQAQLCLQGAQLLQFKPTQQQDWLWLSPYAQYQYNEPIRGGIPLCLPWFGVNQQVPHKPKHGFVRQQEWQLEDIKESSESLCLQLSYYYAGDHAEWFANAFKVQMTLILSDHIAIHLNISNLSEQTMPLSWALHSYFAVNDCQTTHISGLEHLPYLDNTKNLHTFVESTAVQFLGEVDRVYNHTTTAQTLHAQHQLRIEGDNCPSCIVWNAGEINALNISDIGDSVRSYVCVERGAAFADALILKSHATFTASMMISKMT